MLNNQMKYRDRDVIALAKYRFRLALIVSMLFLIFFMMLPILASYTLVLGNVLFGSISWAYMYAFSLFPIGWLLSIAYLLFCRYQDEKIIAAYGYQGES